MINQSANMMEEEKLFVVNVKKRSKILTNVNLDMLILINFTCILKQ